MAEKAIPPVGWILISLVCFILLIMLLWSYLYDVKIGKGAGKVLAYIFGMYSQTIGSAINWIVDTIIWF